MFLNKAMVLFLYSTIQVLRGGVWSLFGLSFLSVTMAIAEGNNATTSYYPVITNTVSQEYLTLAKSKSIFSEIKYVEKTNQNFFSDVIVAKKGSADGDSSGSSGDHRGRYFGGDYGVMIVIFTVMLSLLLFLKYGSVGGLLDKPTDSGESRRKKAKAWGVDVQNTVAENIFDQLDALKNQREKLILLLRHCLLRAGDETNTGFARADTEREAFKRLPVAWWASEQLESLLLNTELVHYGGRLLDEETFLTCVKNGKAILALANSDTSAK